MANMTDSSKISIKKVLLRFSRTFCISTPRIILNRERESHHGPKHSQQDGALKPHASNVPPKNKSDAVAMNVFGPKNLTRAAKAVKKSATRKDPPSAAIAEAPTNLPAVTLVDAARYPRGLCVAVFEQACPLALIVCQSRH
jgi:hypothetical protein